MFLPDGWDPRTKKVEVSFPATLDHDAMKSLNIDKSARRWSDIFPMLVPKHALAKFTQK